MFFVVLNYGHGSEVVVKCDVGRLQTGLTPHGLLPVAVQRRLTTSSVPSHLSIQVVFEHLLSWSHPVNLDDDMDDSSLVIFL